VFGILWGLHGAIMAQVTFWTNWLKNQESAKEKVASEKKYKELERKVDELEKRSDGRLSELEREVTELQRAFVLWGGDEDKS
jgi:hypothetical protein